MRTREVLIGRNTKTSTVDLDLSGVPFGKSVSRYQVKNIHTHTHTHTYIYIPTHIHTHTYTHIHTHNTQTHTHTHTHTYIHTQLHIPSHISQAVVKVRENGSFRVLNLARRPISVNGRSLLPSCKVPSLSLSLPLPLSPFFSPTNTILLSILLVNYCFFIIIIFFLLLL